MYNFTTLCLVVFHHLIFLFFWIINSKKQGKQKK
jgi:preprotein translocase subunit YajC